MKLVQFFTNEYGDKEEDNSWHGVISLGEAERAICNGQVFGFGESSVKFEEKNVKSGGITCVNCIAIIKWYKRIKLSNK